MQPKKIITHAGTFHAAEVSALALLLELFPGTPYERTYTPTDADFNDPGTVVMDIGRRYQPQLNNFDHHQGATLPAANMLILKHFVRPHNPRLAELLETQMFGYISTVDVGGIVEPTGESHTISGIVRTFNNLENGFELALAMMRNIIRSQIATAEKRIWAETEWATNVEKHECYAIHDSDYYLVGWQEMAKEENINFLVTPNPRGGYQITSRDSENFPIPKDSRQTFLHNNQFIAAYPTLQDAIDHCEEIALAIQKEFFLKETIDHAYNLDCIGGYGFYYSSAYYEDNSSEYNEKIKEWLSDPSISLDAFKEMLPQP